MPPENSTPCDGDNGVSSQRDASVIPIRISPPPPGRHAAAETSAATQPPGAGRLSGIVKQVGQHLVVSDDQLIEVVLAGVVAHRAPGRDPFWLLLVGASSDGKTELLQALTGVPDVFPLSTLTHKTLLSGASTRDTGNNASLLHKLKGQILVVKDMTTMLELYTETRQQLFAQLREMYDGSMKKAFGTGEEVSWEGKVGFLAGVTPVIDQHHKDLALMGAAAPLLPHAIDGGTPSGRRTACPVWHG